MKRRIEVNKSSNKSLSKSLSKQAMQRHSKEQSYSKDSITLQEKTISKSYNKGRIQQLPSSHKKPKDPKKEPAHINHQLKKAAPKQVIATIHNRPKRPISEQKNQKNGKLFQRKNNHQAKSSKKISKKNSNNQNDSNEIERLKTQNEYYKKAFLASKESLQKMQKYLQQQKKKRANNNVWFKNQISNLKKQITSDKVKLSHIFTYEPFHNEEISNMIIQTQNESSSLFCPNRGEEPEGTLSNLSLQSK